MLILQKSLATGTVVVLDRRATNRVTASTHAYDIGVAGVVSEKPGVILGEAGPNKVQIATTGRVHVKVDASRAAVGIGDLLVTSDTPGFAMKSEPLEVQGRSFHQPGTLIGKRSSRWHWERARSSCCCRCNCGQGRMSSTSA